MFLAVLETIAVITSCVIASIYGVHYLQMSRYQLTVYRQWITRTHDGFLWRYAAIGITASILWWYLRYFLSLFILSTQNRVTVGRWLTLILYATVTTIISVSEMRSSAMKKPLVLTMRARRLFAVIIALYIILFAIVRVCSLPPYLVYITVPYAILLGGKIIEPLEERINARFYQQAKQKLCAKKGLVRIGITGSNGKTLTKFILKALLSERYEVLATPASFNTAMGISRVINDQLEDKHQVFIAEMGAQHLHDIEYLVKLVHPQYGIITSIGSEHLETFGSIGNILEGKFELIQGLPKNGIAFFASESGNSDRLFERCEREKYSVAVDKEGDYYMNSSIISMDSHGTTFMLSCADGSSSKCRTVLLGRYNIQNITLAAAVAHKLGLSMDEIATGIEKLMPFEKKLQLIQGEPMVIDDTYNKTTNGAAEALDVISHFPGKRIIVTPGLHSANAKNDEENFSFGMQMRDCVDCIVLVGTTNEISMIREGAMRVGFTKRQIRIVRDFDDAESVLEDIAGPGDTILYEGSADS